MARIVLVPISQIKSLFKQGTQVSHVWARDLISHPSTPSLSHDIWPPWSPSVLAPDYFKLWVCVPPGFSSFIISVAFPLLAFEFCCVLKNIIHYILSRITVFDVAWGSFLHMFTFLTCAMPSLPPLTFYFRIFFFLKIDQLDRGAGVYKYLVSFSAKCLGLYEARFSR